MVECLSMTSLGSTNYPKLTRRGSHLHRNLVSDLTVGHRAIHISVVLLTFTVADARLCLRVMDQFKGGLIRWATLLYWRLYPVSS